MAEETGYSMLPNIARVFDRNGKEHFVQSHSSMSGEHPYLGQMLPVGQHALEATTSDNTGQGYAWPQGPPYTEAISPQGSGQRPVLHPSNCGVGYSGTSNIGTPVGWAGYAGNNLQLGGNFPR